MIKERDIGIVLDERFKLHKGPTGHPENPNRLIEVEAGIKKLQGKVTAIEARLAQDSEILFVHSPNYLKNLKELPANSIKLDQDTYWCKNSLQVASLAVGSAIELTQKIADGDIRSGLAFSRPPGHHAEAEKAMGFCIFNNIAIAAENLQRSKAAERIVIVDWDVHHGNGTQHHFEGDPNTLYISTHQFPFYPGTGSASEKGFGKGEGATLNVPMPPNCGEKEYIGVFQHVIEPAIRKFAPDIILASCGFDSHFSDPLAQMENTATGFKGMTLIIRALADELCGGRLAILLEGGYSAKALQEGGKAVLEAILPASVGQLPETQAVELNSRLEKILGQIN